MDRFLVCFKPKLEEIIIMLLYTIERRKIMVIRERMCNREVYKRALWDFNIKRMKGYFKCAYAVLIGIAFAFTP